MIELAQNIKHYTIPIFIPHAACPFQCVFCNQKKITDKQKSPTAEETKNIINKHLATISKQNSLVDIGFFGGSFTAIPLQEQEKYMSLAYEYMNNNKVDGIRISTRPDFINAETITLLKKYGVTTIELGAQSMDEEVLYHSGRGHKVEHVVYASELIKKSGLNLVLQMMIGLPYDTLEKSKETAKQIIKLQADYARIYPTLVIKDTILEMLYYNDKYKPLSIDEAVEWTKEVYTIFLNSNTQIIRIGLHPSEGLKNGDSLIAGPFHPSFKELVLTKIWKDLFSEFKFESKKERITIYVAREQLNAAIGYHSINKNMLKEKFTSVLFKTDSTLKGNIFYVNYN